jgi:hypothetical protein
MKIELVESTLVYNISVDEKEYTLYISETDNSYYNQELIDENGNPVDDEDLLEQIMDEISDIPLGFLK